MILEKIVRAKKEIISSQKGVVSIEKLVGEINRTPLSLKRSLKKNTFGIIAEIKRASPSAGSIDKNINIEGTARIYFESGVSGISILTCEPFFYGSTDDLKSVREIVKIPLLMKDFIFDPYQIYQARAYGADAVLLIIRILSDEDFLRLLNTAENLMLEVLVEIHTEEELKRALRLVENWDNKVLGINNRNLETLKTDLNVTLNLIKSLFGYKITVISESGINNREDVEALKNAGVQGALIGESLLKSGNIKSKLKELNLSP
jgi:indole-3-glycerol phosphate synthase